MIQQVHIVIKFKGYKIVLKFQLIIVKVTKG